MRCFSCFVMFSCECSWVPQNKDCQDLWHPGIHSTECKILRFSYPTHIFGLQCVYSMMVIFIPRVYSNMPSYFTILSCFSHQFYSIFFNDPNHLFHTQECITQELGEIKVDSKHDSTGCQSTRSAPRSLYRHTNLDGCVRLYGPQYASVLQALASSVSALWLWSFKVCTKTLESWCIEYSIWMMTYYR